VGKPVRYRNRPLLLIIPSNTVLYPYPWTAKSTELADLVKVDEKRENTDKSDVFEVKQWAGATKHEPFRE